MRNSERTLKGGERSELLWDPRSGGGGGGDNTAGCLVSSTQQKEA